MDDDNNQLIDKLETVEELLENNIGYWSSPQMTKLLFNKLFMLIKCDRKEVRLKITKISENKLSFLS